MGRSQPVADDLRSFVEQHRLGHITDDRIILCDLLNSSETYRRFVMPSSIASEEYVSEGVAFLQDARPKVIVILTMHRDAKDFNNLLAVAGNVLERSPVSAVEARCAEPPQFAALVRPRFTDENPWLKKFQKAQFKWHNQNGKAMVPSEPHFLGKLGRRYADLIQLFYKLKDDRQGYSDEVRQQIMELLYANVSITRAWGILGQYGWWRKHPVVQELLADTTEPVPLTLGRAHGYEVEVLKTWGVDVEVIDVITHLNTADAREQMKKPSAAEYQRVVSSGFVMHTDLGARKFM